MKEGFKSIDDILIEVANEENMTIAELKDIWRHQRNYVKKQMDSEDVYAILIPYIGTLSLNVKQYTKELKRKTKSFYRNFIEKVEKLKNHKNFKRKENAHKKITGVNRLARYIIKNYDTGIDNNKNLMSHKECWDIILKYSNGQFKKI